MKKYLLILVVLVTILAECHGIWNVLMNLLPSKLLGVPEDAKLNITQLAKKYGYDIREHDVVTQDGYILTLHRLANNTMKSNGPPVLLMHGLMECSDGWLLQGPVYALAYIMADSGFDVWMGNARGNKHSLKHKSLDYTSVDFWKFTWEEIGVYDLPAMIDYILLTTKRENLYYVGHSQGTTSGYVLLSMKPEYNKKINIMFSLAPEAFMANVKSPFIKLFSTTVNYLASTLLNISPYSPGTEMFHKLVPLLCEKWLADCENILYFMSGSDNRINKTLVPIIFGHSPTGSSTLQFIHYGQLVNSERFCRYDYGEGKNLKVYGQIKPPDYDLSKIVAPMVLFYAGNDWMSQVTDVNQLKMKLPNVWGYIFLKNYTHLDYLYAKEAREDIYLKIISKINKAEYSNLVK